MFRRLAALFGPAARRPVESARLGVTPLEAREVPAALTWDLSAVSSAVVKWTAPPPPPTSYLWATIAPVKGVSYPLNLAGYTNPCF